MASYNNLPQVGGSKKKKGFSRLSKKWRTDPMNNGHMVFKPGKRNVFHTDMKNLLTAYYEHKKETNRMRNEIYDDEKYKSIDHNERVDIMNKATEYRKKQLDEIIHKINLKYDECINEDAKIDLWDWTERCCSCCIDSEETKSEEPELTGEKLKNFIEVNQYCRRLPKILRFVIFNKFEQESLAIIEVMNEEQLYDSISNSEHETALHFAIRAGLESVIIAILNKTTKKYINSRAGKYTWETPFRSYIEQKNCSKQVIDMFREKGATKDSLFMEHMKVRIRSIGRIMVMYNSFIADRYKPYGKGMHKAKNEFCIIATNKF